MGDRKTTAANGSDGTGCTCLTARSIAMRHLGLVDLCNALLKDIADCRREFPTGMGFSVRENSDEVERSATAVPGTSTKGLDALLVAHDIHKVVF